MPHGWDVQGEANVQVVGSPIVFAYCMCARITRATAVRSRRDTRSSTGPCVRQRQMGNFKAVKKAFTSLP